MVINNLEIEIKKYDKGYSFSSEENGKKRIYTIYSPELRQKIREIVSPYGILGKANIQYNGENRDGDRILYQQGKDDLPDQLTLISREVEDKKELKEVDEWEKINAEFKEIEDEWKRREEEWKKRENELGIPNSYIKKHSWCSWNNDGSIGTEGMYIKSENQSQLITFENKVNSPQIQEITDKEAERIKTENFPNSDKKDQQLEKEIDQQKNSLQKTNNKDNNKNVYYGIGAISLVLLLTSMIVVWMKKKRQLNKKLGGS